MQSDLLSHSKSLRSPQKRAQNVSLKEVDIQQFAQWSNALLDLQRSRLLMSLGSLQANWEARAVPVCSEEKTSETRVPSFMSLL